MAQRGACVVVNDIGCSMHGEGNNRQVADQVVDEIHEAGGTAIASYDSVGSPEGGEAIVRTALSHSGRVDAVVSNAGIFDTSPFEDLSAGQWRNMLNTHLDGSFHLCQPAFRHMKQQGYGRLVLVASSAALFGLPNEAHYAAAKGGIFGLSNVLALEGAAHGVLSNALLPTGYSRMVEQTDGSAVTGDAVQSGDDNPFRRMIAPELVVPMVTFLASRNCTFSHRNYAACAGRYSRVFVGLAQGWLSPSDSRPTAEDIESNIDAISATETFTIPNSLFDEVGEAMGLRGRTLS
jgi:NAD(P)-dependent dehydrogenase (short-subunit alcohol dehydrogenase family)